MVIIMPCGQIKLLIVDDDPLDRRLLARALEDLGYPPPITADSGQKALELARQRRPDLVLMDIGLGGAMDGVDTLVCLWSELGVPGLFLTGVSDPEVVERALAADAYGYLAKPVTKLGLHGAIQSALRRFKAESLLERSRAKQLQEANAELSVRQEELEAINQQLRRAHSELQASLDRYTVLYERAPVGYFTLDHQGRILQVNRAGAAMAGRLEGEMVGHDLGQYWAPGQVSQFRDYLDRIKSGREGLDCELTLDGPEETATFVHLEGASIPQGQEFQYLLAMVDVTQRRRFEEQLLESEKLFHRIFDLSPIGAAMVGLDFRFLRVNQELSRLTGYGAEELTAMSFPDITYPDDLEANVSQAQAMMAGDIDHYQMDKRYLRKDGRIVWIRLSVRAVRDAQGRIMYFLPMMEDIDEAKRALHVIRRNEKELQSKNKRLEEMNAAFQVLMQHREREREEFATRMVTNLKTLVLPYVELLKGRSLSPEARTLVDILEDNLNEAALPIAPTISGPAVHFTSTEIRIADLVRRGKSSKEIAVLINMSLRMVAFHRNNLRKKLGIGGSRKGNLRAAIMSIMSDDIVR